MKGRKLSTGINETLDRELNGGIPGGSILVFTAPPDSPSELILQEMMKERTTLYLTTTRSDDAVRASMEANGVSPDMNCFIGDIDAADVEADALMQGCMDRVEEMLSRMKSERYDLADSEYNIIIDTADVLEMEKHGWVTKFFRNMRAAMSEVDSDGLFILHCTKGEQTPEHRDLMLSLADVVWDLEKVIEGGEITYDLYIPKNRGGTALMESFQLELTDNVDVDTSRDI